MGVTAVGPVLIWSNALIAGAWLDPQQIIYVSQLIRKSPFCLKIYDTILKLDLTFLAFM